MSVGVLPDVFKTRRPFVEHIAMLPPPNRLPGTTIRVAWVDNYQLTRECMTVALSHGNSPLRTIPYDSLAALIATPEKQALDLIVLNTHDLGHSLPEDIAALRKAGFVQPIVVVSENEMAGQMASVVTSLRLGASGHLPVQSTGIDMAISSFIFAHEGGTFAPVELLLAEDQKGGHDAPLPFAAEHHGTPGAGGHRRRRARKSVAGAVDAASIPGSSKS